MSNVLAGTHSFTESLQLVQVDDYMPKDTRTEIPSGAEDLLLQKNLYCMTSGPLPPNPAELMGSAKMQQLLRTAAEAADYVIIDAPPLLVAADPVSLAPLVDGVLLTARLYVTTRDEARAARELLHRVGAHVIGAVALGGKQSNELLPPRLLHGVPLVRVARVHRQGLTPASAAACWEANRSVG